MLNAKNVSFTDMHSVKFMSDLLLPVLLKMAILI